MSSALAPLRAAPRLPRTVKLLGAVSLLNDFASEMIYPLLPAFMAGVLGAGPQALGALDGAAEFAASVVKFGAGRLADRRPGGRRLAAPRGRPPGPVGAGPCRPPGQPGGSGLRREG